LADEAAGNSARTVKLVDDAGRRAPARIERKPNDINPTAVIGNGANGTPTSPNGGAGGLLDGNGGAGFSQTASGVAGSSGGAAGLLGNGGAGELRPEHRDDNL